MEAVIVIGMINVMSILAAFMLGYFLGVRDGVIDANDELTAKKKDFKNGK